MRKWIDLFEQKDFANAHCDALAVELSNLLACQVGTLHALHVKAGGQTRRDPDFIHAFALSRGTAFDYLGARSISEIENEYRHYLDLVRQSDDTEVKFDLVIHDDADDFIENTGCNPDTSFARSHAQAVASDYNNLHEGTQWALEEQVSDPTALVYQVREELLDESGLSPQQFNQGLCMEFSDELERRSDDFQSYEWGNFYNHETGGDCNDATGFSEKWLSGFPEWRPPAGLTWEVLFSDYGFNWTGMHVWAFCKSNRLCYDVEAPEGVSNVFDLPFFQRVIQSGPRARTKVTEDANPSDAAKPAVRELVARAAQNGVNIEIEFGIDSILLIEIERTTSPKGTATKYMTELCAIADKHDLGIMLHVAGGMRKLVNYYERFGFFVDVDEENEDNHHTDSDEHSYGYEVPMYRDPS